MCVPISIHLVTPVWNDSDRLAAYGPSLASELAATQLRVHWTIADDGSSKTEKEALISLTRTLTDIYPEIHLHHADAHRGKGSIIREAWTRHPMAEWFAFVDADGSVSAADMLRLIRTSIEHRRSTIGIRKRTRDSAIRESLLRKVTHHTFLAIARLVLGLESGDLQCGAKVISGDAYRQISPFLFENGLAFDCELLAALRSHHLSWEEVPISWTEKDGGKVRPLIDGWHMLRSLVRIRSHLPPNLRRP